MIGDTLKLLNKKRLVVNERVEESPAWIDKLEVIFCNLSSAFSSVKTIEKTPTSKNCKSTHVPKNKGFTSSNNDEVIKNPTYKSEFFNFIPWSVIIEDMHARSLRNYVCVIEEFETKEDNT